MEELTAALEALARDRDVRVSSSTPPGRRSAPATTSARWSIATSPSTSALFDICTEMMETIHAAAAAGDRAGARASRPPPAASSSPPATSRSPPRSARFATPGVKIGLFCSTPMVPLSRAIGRKRALEMLLTGRRSTPPRPCEWGLVNRVVAGRRARRDGRRARRAIAASSPLTVGDRQGGVLRADRPRRAPRLRPHEGRDGDERARRRRAGGHLRVPREAPAGLARDVAAPGGGRSRRPMAPITAGRGQGERQRLAVRARPERVVGVDALAEPERELIVGDRPGRTSAGSADWPTSRRCCTPCPCWSRSRPRLQWLRQEERAVDQMAGVLRARVGHAQHRVARGRDHARRSSTPQVAPTPGTYDGNWAAGPSSATASPARCR